MILSDLSPYIVKQILYYIDKPHQVTAFGSVCKKFIKVAYEMFVNVDLTEYATEASQRTILGLVHNSTSYLQSLVLTGCRNVSDDTLDAVSRCIHLRKLVLSWVDMKTTEEGLQNIHKCTALSSLSISNPEWSFPDVAFPRVLNAQGFEYISQCTSLTELSIRGPPCSRLTVQSFFYLLHCTKLKTLHIDTRKANCNFLITDEMFEYIHLLPNLETLSFSGLSKDVTERGVKNIGKLPSLTSLSLQYQWGMGVSLKFLEECTNLRVLNLDFPLLKSEEFEKFNVFCSPTLLNLELTHGTYLLNRHIPQLGWFALRSLSLYSAVNITDDGLKFLGEYCQTLQTLELVSCHNISGDGFFHLGMCTQLTTLKLRQCRNIGDDAFKWLPFILVLRHVTLDGLNKITDTSLDLLLDCASLRELQLKSCNTITLQGVLTLSQNSVTLKHVHIVDCKSIVSMKNWKQSVAAATSPRNPHRQQQRALRGGGISPLSHPNLKITLNKTETILLNSQFSHLKYNQSAS
jgi:hypothetical protein